MLIVDMSVAPADITFPMDIKLLNTAREKTERLIDVIYNSSEFHKVKPRTYRKRARRDYLAIAKQRNGEAIPSGKEPKNNTESTSQMAKQFLRNSLAMLDVTSKQYTNFWTLRRRH
jgi:hypothetical protein